MQAWLATPRGRLLLQRQRRQIRAVLPHFFGYRLLQIGDWDFEEDVLSASATLCQWVLGSAHNPQAAVVFDGQALPVRSRSVDAVVLPHSLEVLDSPHRLLREVDRVLNDHGHLVISGFNPFSPWSVRQRAAQRFKATANVPRQHYSLGRVCDWLDLLDYELLSASRYGVGFPYLPDEGVDVANAGWWRLPGVLGQAYIVVARKRVMASTAQRRAQHSTPLRAAGLPKASARSRQYGLKKL